MTKGLTGQQGKKLPLWRRFTIPSAVRDFFVLASGTGFGHLVILAVTPVLTRLLLPADMGLFGLFTTFVAVLSVISSLGFETAIIGARDEDELSLVGIACSFTMLITIVGGMILWIVQSFQLIQGLPSWFPWLVAFDTLLANFFIAAQCWYIRQERYKRAALGSFSVNSGRGIGSIACAATLAGPVALPAGDCIGRGLGLIVIDRLYVVPRALTYVVTAPAIAWATVRRYWKSAIFLMPAAALETALFWLPVLLSTAVYGIEMAGYVALVQRLLAAPLALVGRSLSDIYQVRITGHGTAMPERMMWATFTVIGGAFVLAIPAWLVLIFWGAPIFVIVFGRNWATAGDVVGILAPLATFQLCGNIITRLLIEMGRQELKLIAFLVLLVSMFANFYLGYLLQWTALTTLTTMSASGCIIMAIWISVSLVVCHNSRVIHL